MVMSRRRAPVGLWMYTCDGALSSVATNTRPAVDATPASGDGSDVTVVTVPNGGGETGTLPTELAAAGLVVAVAATERRAPVASGAAALAAPAALFVCTPVAAGTVGTGLTNG